MARLASPIRISLCFRLVSAFSYSLPGPLASTITQLQLLFPSQQKRTGRHNHLHFFLFLFLRHHAIYINNTKRTPPSLKINQTTCITYLSTSHLCFLCYSIRFSHLRSIIAIKRNQSKLFLLPTRIKLASYPAFFLETALRNIHHLHSLFRCLRTL